jgi:myosin V
MTASPCIPIATTSKNEELSDSSCSRVWVRQSAIVKQPKSFKATRLSSGTSTVSTPIISNHNSKVVLNNKQPLVHNNGSFSTQITASDLTDSSSCESSSLSCRTSLAWDWKEAIVQDQTADTLTVRMLHSNEVYSFPSTAIGEHVLAANEPALGNIGNSSNEDENNNEVTVDDLITLTHLHEPAVVHALQRRYAADCIYTFTGPVLLALNPFQTVRGLYGEAVQRKYVEAAEQHDCTMPPHVYAIADAAFRSMMRALEDSISVPNISAMEASTSSTIVVNQSILVSGESGSGKTVTTKFVMKYLAALSQRSVLLAKPAERAYKQVQSWRQQPQLSQDCDLMDSVDTIEAQVLQSNPVLESFGNARTVRNDNSSRFGKFIEIQFTASGKLVGASLETYLLEKIRLIRQCAGERNYHIFYELLQGASKRELSHLYLSVTATPDDFKLTCSGTHTRRDGVTDRETYAGLQLALQTMKFSKADIQSVFSVVGAILHASNLNFVEGENDTCRLHEENPHIEPVCALLGLTAEDLNEALCHCTLTAGASTTVKRSLNADQAASGLESLMKETYGALFQYLVRRINDQIAAAPADKGVAVIGVLDIFGFESFGVNSFEQLCINYCNEALQQQFNAFVLENEQAEYKREGIEWSFIDFPENQDVLDLIELQKAPSLLSILDDQCRAPGPSDKAFCLAVYSQCGSFPRFEANRKQQAMLQFSIHHYAGPVEYTTAGFTAKNKDELPKETVVLLSNSVKPLVSELAAILESGHDTSGAPEQTPRKQLHRADSSVGRPTVGGQFRRQLKALRQKIDKTAPHYIRCLKPNDMLVPDHFDTAIVAEQLKCGGILEAVRVARAGFTQHYPHADFLRRYRALAWKELSMKGAVPPSPTFSPPVRGTSARSTSFRNSYPVQSFLPKSASTSVDKKTIKPELSPGEAKLQCKDLIKILYKKIVQQGFVLETTPGAEPIPEPSPVAKAKSYSVSSPAPSWLKPSSTPRLSSSPTLYLPPSGSVKSSRGRMSEPAPSPSKSWKRGPVTTADFGKVGIQLGKTKVFLRHKAFEVLERIRSTELTNAATLLNSVFRCYLSRMAYLQYRNACRSARDQRKVIEECDDGFKECKESEYGDNSINRSFQSVHQSFNSSYASESLVDKWTEAQIKEALHNPVPRHEWGKQIVDATKFQWVIEDGVWVKNYNLTGDTD